MTVNFLIRDTGGKEIQECWFLIRKHALTCQQLMEYQYGLPCWIVERDLEDELTTVWGDVVA